MFPDDAAMTNLANWHAFEREHPYTFAGMYCSGSAGEADEALPRRFTDHPAGARSQATTPWRCGRAENTG